MEINTEINNMNVKELKQYCRDNNIDGYSKLNKSELLDLIKSKDNDDEVKILEKKIIKIKNKKRNSNQLKFVDLFCGIGGFHIALKKLGCECVLACDIDKKCRETYIENFDIEPVEDVKKINEKEMIDFDILCAGFPCQPFSNGGNKKSFKDDRGLLFDEIIRIAKYKKPRFMFLENVKHILKVSNGEVLEYIKQKIKDIGYTLQMFKMSPHDYGIPQQRERIYFVCIRNDIYNNNDINLFGENKNLTIDDIIKNNNDEYKIKGDIKEVLDAWNELIQQFEIGQKMSPTILMHDYFKNYSDEEFEGLADWRRDYITKNKPLFAKYIHIIEPWYEKYKKILNKREIYGKLEWQVGHLKENDSIYNYSIQFRQSGIRVKKTNYFPTLVAISQIPIYGKTQSYITPRECARLQSFPEDYILDESDRVVYKQMGNSVNVHNVYTVINSTLKHYQLV